MEKRWIKAATILPPTLKVCGRNLLPFCLKHRVALESINSPVLNVSGKITPRDLLFAVRILSTYNIEETRKSMTLRESFLLVLYSVNQARFLREVFKLNVYFNAQSLWPRFWEKSGTGSAAEIPWPLTIIAGLVRNGVSLAEAWQMPESEAVWLHIANCKANGAKVDLVSETEWDAMQRYMNDQKLDSSKSINRN